MANKTKGTVKFYNGEKDVFVHASQLDGFGSTLDMVLYLNQSL